MICYKCKKEIKTYKILACDKPYYNLSFCPEHYPVEKSERDKFTKEFLLEQRSQSSTSSQSGVIKKRK